MKEIFRPFSHKSSTYSDEGIGLGLLIVKTIVEAHGGSIIVESQLGVGSSFLIFLPAINEAKTTIY